MVELEEVDLAKVLAILSKRLARTAADIMIELDSPERTYELADALAETARLLRERAMVTSPKVIESRDRQWGCGAMGYVDPRNVKGLTVAWGRSVLEPTRGHVREMHEGQPVTNRVGDAVVGMAFCGALLIDDLAPEIAAGEFDKCSVCLELLEEIRRTTVDPSPPPDMGD
jgi:hypothetical protein